MGFSPKPLYRSLIWDVKTKQLTIANLSLSTLFSTLNIAMISSSAYVASDASFSGKIVSSPNLTYSHDYLPQQNFYQLRPSVVLADAYSSEQLITQNLEYDISDQSSTQFPNTSPGYIPNRSPEQFPNTSLEYIPNTSPGYIPNRSPEQFPNTSPEFIQSTFDTSSFSPTKNSYIPTTGSYIPTTGSYIPTTGSYVSCTESFQASFNQVMNLNLGKFI